MAIESENVAVTETESAPADAGDAVAVENDAVEVETPDTDEIEVDEDAQPKDEAAPIEAPKGEAVEGEPTTVEGWREHAKQQGELVKRLAETLERDAQAREAERAEARQEKQAKRGSAFDRYDGAKGLKPEERQAVSHQVAAALEDLTGLDMEGIKQLPQVVKRLNDTVTYGRIESEQMKEQAALRAAGFSEAQIQKADEEAKQAFQRGEVRSYRAAYRMVLFDQKAAGAPTAQRIAKADAEKAGRAFKLGNAAKGNAGGINRGSASNEAELSKDALAAAARGDIRLALRELGRNQKP